MSSDVRRSNGTRRTAVRNWLRSQHRPCWICRAFGRSGEIDYSLPTRHPLSFEVDELVPVSLGGSPFARSNVDAAHRCCNEWRSNKTVDEVLRIARGADATPPPPTEPVQGVTSGLLG